MHEVKRQDKRVPGRDELLDCLRQRRQWDVLVIGGGATGLGSAVDAAARGYSTLLVEAHDFAKGTSSRSTKLIHGGVRYLAQGRIGMVRESLQERWLLLQNAPHLVSPLRFVVPAYRPWEQSWFGLGLSAYDVLAGAHGVGRSEWLGPSSTEGLLPNVRRTGLRGGIAYQDAQFDDARLALCLARTIIDLGGTAINYMRVVRLLHKVGRCEGAVVENSETGESFEISARVVINATGVWADQVREFDEPGLRPLIYPSQGIHLTVDRSFMAGDSALLIPSTDDGRVLFVIPWQDKVLLGTTDTPKENVSFEPQPVEGEVDYVLRVSGRYLERAPTVADVRSVFSGLRPLIRGPNGSPSSVLSREHAIVVSPSGLLTVGGGKWTTYRRMAEQTIDRAEQIGALGRRHTHTRGLLLHGAERGACGDRWGGDREIVEQMAGAGRLVHPGLSLTEAEVRYAVEYEQARQVEDVLARRHRALFLDAAAATEAAPAVACLMADALGLKEKASLDWQAEQVAAFASLAERYKVSLVRG